MAKPKDKKPVFVPRAVLRKKQDQKTWREQSKGFIEELKRQGEIRREKQLELFPYQPLEIKNA